MKNNILRRTLVGKGTDMSHAKSYSRLFAPFVHRHNDEFSQCDNRSLCFTTDSLCRSASGFPSLPLIRPLIQQELELRRMEDQGRKDRQGSLPSEPQHTEDAVLIFSSSGTTRWNREVFVDRFRNRSNETSRLGKVMAPPKSVPTRRQREAAPRRLTTCETGGCNCAAAL
jgi:hypothetical protein